MKTVFSIVGFVFFTLLPASIHAAGALAIDENQGQKWGWAIDYPTVAEAIARAKKECGEKCYVPLVFSSGCAAYAADQTKGSTAWGWGRSDKGETARSRALSECSKRGGAGANCIVRSWGCHSKKGAGGSAAQSGERAFVWVDLKLNAESTYTRYCGITKLRDDDIHAYSEGVYEILFWDKHFGKDTQATFLSTPGPGGKSVSGSPVMQKLAAIVKNHPHYGKRDTRTEFFRGLETAYSTRKGVRFWNFQGDIVKITVEQSVADLKKFYCEHRVEDLRGIGMKYSVVDIGEF